MEELNERSWWRVSASVVFFGNIGLSVILPVLKLAEATIMLTKFILRLKIAQSSIYLPR